MQATARSASEGRSMVNSVDTILILRQRWPATFAGLENSAEQRFDPVNKSRASQGTTGPLVLA